MITSDVKKTAKMLVSDMGSGKKSLDDTRATSGLDDDESSGQHAAAGDIIDAIKADDHKALSDALNAHYEMYDDESPGTENPGPDENVD